MPDALRPLSPPDIPAVRYAKNFIKTAVCELRFPALLELEAKPPHAFQKLIRKAYPIYEPQVVEMGAGEEALRENRYLFRSTDKQWTVSVKSFALSLETSKYIDFEDFFDRLMVVIRSAEPLIDADFFTRVGLRYINKITIEDGNPRDWISKDLLAPLRNDVLGTLSNYRCVLAGSLKNGSYTLRHGVGGDEAAAATGPKLEYTLDFDYYCENLKAAAVPDRLKEFNRTNFAFFSWCLGAKAKAVLGEGKPK
jgi:uncharacterized protein (TIGR04255 family)